MKKRERESHVAEYFFSAIYVFVYKGFVFINFLLFNLISTVNFCSIYECCFLNRMSINFSGTLLLKFEESNLSEALKLSGHGCEMPKEESVR